MRWAVRGEVDPDVDVGQPPAGRLVRLDYDRPRLPAALVWRVAVVLARLRVRPELVLCRRTVRGWHVKVVLSRRLSPLVIVAVQAILGSDPHRETFNLVRARSLRGAPARWRNRYSVLFLRKLEA